MYTYMYTYIGNAHTPSDEHPDAAAVPPAADRQPQQLQ